MKKVVLLLSIFCMGFLVSQAQGDFRIAGGVSLKQGLTHGTLELGSTDNVNTWGLVGETFETNDNREYFVGVKYLHQTAIGNAAHFVLGGAAKIHVDSDKALLFEPETGVLLNLSPTVGVLGSISYPIADNSNLFRPVQLSGNLQLVLKL
jgi:hypothetical protein